MLCAAFEAYEIVDRNCFSSATKGRVKRFDDREHFRPGDAVGRQCVPSRRDSTRPSARSRMSCCDIGTWSMPSNSRSSATERSSFPSAQRTRSRCGWDKLLSRSAAFPEAGIISFTFILLNLKSLNVNCKPIGRPPNAQPCGTALTGLGIEPDQRKPAVYLSGCSNKKHWEKPYVACRRPRGRSWWNHHGL